MEVSRPSAFVPSFARNRFQRMSPVLFVVDGIGNAKVKIAFPRGTIKKAREKENPFKGKSDLDGYFASVLDSLDFREISP